MDSSKLIFNEAQIRGKLFPFDSPSRLSLNDTRFTKSAILFLIIPYSAKPYDLVLIRRTKSDKDKHSGEMAFPGGLVEVQDSSLEYTALRECEEELGIPKEKINVLGSFDDHITPKHFIVTPIVGYIDGQLKMVKDDEEVQEIIRIPINFFANKKNYRERTYELKGITIAVGKYKYKAPNDKRYVIFGMTSHLIVHFIQQVYDLSLMRPGARRLTCSDF